LPDQLRPPISIPSIVVFILLCLSGTTGNAQLYFKARTITVENGLSDKRVTCFYKDRNGFMWIGTRNGLNRYDGHGFRIFRPAEGNSISNEVINDIAEDREGRIWVATMEGLNCYDPVSNHWESLVPDPDIRGTSIPNYIIWDIWFDKNDLLWIASDVFEFSSYHLKTKKFTYYHWPHWARANVNPKPDVIGGRYNSIHKFVARDANRFWLGTTKGLVELDIRTDSFRLVGSNYYADVYDLRYDTINKQVFVSTESGRIFRYDETKDQYKEILYQTESYPSSHYLPPGKQEIWMASDVGLLKISDDRNTIYKVSNISQLAGSLLPGGVRCVYVDNTNIRWIATPNGINTYDPGGLFARFLPLLAVSDKEGSNRMGGVMYDGTSHSYFACANDPAVVFRVDAVTGVIEKITTDAAGRKLSACNTMEKDYNNTLWLFTDDHMYRYDRVTGKFVEFPTPNNGARVRFRDFTIDADGNYWFASFYGGVYFYNTTKKEFIRLDDTTNAWLNAATAVIPDNANRQLVVATFGQGVFTYHLDTKKLQGYYETREARDYSQLGLIHDGGKDARGHIWLGSHSGGIYQYHSNRPFETTFSRYDMRKGLNSNSVISLCHDGGATIWLLSGNGISAIDTAGRFLYEVKDERAFSFSAFSSENMVPHDIFYNMEAKELLVGVAGGLLFYSPSSSPASIKFPVMITGMRVGGELLSDDDRNSVTGHRFPFRSNAVILEYAGLYYGNEPGIIYEYRLDGYDDDWKIGNGSFTATYQNLPAGNYRFYVRAKNAHGVVAGEVSGFPFRIVPPFWQTAWFKALLVVLIMSGIWWFIYSLRRKLAAEKLLNSFATSLYGQNTIEDIFWDTARNCVEKLGFTDCVIYQVEEERGVLIQRAAFGPKNPQRREILNAIEIPLGKGIVGSVVNSGKAEIVSNTLKDPRYIVDDERRLSEITVPLVVDRKVFGVIDSEHPKKNFYKRYHLRLLKKIAEVSAERISKYLAEEKLRSKIARDLHDEMGSTLTSINIISKVAMQQGMPDEQVKQYLQKIKDNSGRMMESMSDIVWAINPSNDTFDKVIVRMKEFAAEILEPARINYYFSEEGLLDKAQLNLEQRKDIYMVFKEAVNNAVKYSHATEVNIVLQKKDDSLRMLIVDNGNGFDIDQYHPGNGLKNMQSRAREMKAVLRVDSIKGTGTTIILDVAIT
jgi:signal transduction histidine kinase/ligand-binding sensor domain-containing protein